MSKPWYFVTFVGGLFSYDLVIFYEESFCYFLTFVIFVLTFKFSFVFPLKFWDASMLASNSLKHLDCTYVSMKFFINHFVSVLHLKMELLNERIGIFLKLHEHYPFKCVFQGIYGLTQFPQPTSWLIACPPLFSVFKGQIPYQTFVSYVSKIFGCTCFVCNKLTKLDSISLRCIFLSYYCVKKGYRCFCPSLNRCLLRSIDILVCLTCLCLTS